MATTAVNLESQFLGRLILGGTLLLFAYYTLWVIGLPFVDAEYKKSVSAFFPPVELALGIPSLLGTILFGALFLRAYYLVRLDRKDLKTSTTKKES